jgi:hypothetical protein
VKLGAPQTLRELGERPQMVPPRLVKTRKHFPQHAGRIGFGALVLHLGSKFKRPDE